MIIIISFSLSALVRSTKYFSCLNKIKLTKFRQNMVHVLQCGVHATPGGCSSRGTGSTPSAKIEGEK